WFYIDSFPLSPYDDTQPAGYASWQNIRALPKLNVAYQPVRQFLLDVAVYWIKFGIDGWRLDVPNEITDHSFWRDFRVAVKRANPDAYIVGEIWDDATPWLDGTQFDAVMNYPVRTLMVDFFAKRDIGVHAFTAGIEHELQRYARDHVQTAFNVMSSHDTERFLTLAQGNVEQLKTAMLFVMTYVGAPCIYYGDEIGLKGGNDPLNRAAFDWNVQHWNQGLREWVRTCVALRQRFAALRQGRLMLIHARESGRTLAYARMLDREILVVALNASDDDAALDILLSGLGIDDEMLLHDQLSAWSYVVTNQRIQRVKVPAHGGAVLLVARR
ncbi:MAG: alpha-amylase family glycosyl hydrolase, partial [Roseiflexaceae bacterium]